ncbi:hypothetical protein CFP59_02778 [Streptomyces malaysiensis subsp. malaysiensis]|nr:hypothetical protein CFP59_02778 [Streptomyces sp. M56]
MASGTDAAEVLPADLMSSATTTCGGSSSALATASVMRRLAWCGMKADSWSTVTPARLRAAAAVRGTSLIAQRNTSDPAIRIYGQGRSASRTAVQGSWWAMRPCCSPSEPQATEWIPGSAAGPTSTAPAPSAKRKAAPRSSGSTMSVIRSEPITSTRREVPARISPSATARA